MIAAQGTIDRKDAVQTIVPDDIALPVIPAMVENLAAVTQDGLILTDETLSIVWVNDLYSDQSGFVLGDVIGQSLEKRLSQASSDKNTISAYIEAARTAQKTRIQLQRRRKNGQIFWAQLDLAPIFDESGQFIGTLTTQRDITHWIASERGMREALRVAEAEKKRYELAERGSANGIWDWYIPIDLSIFSERFRCLLGYDDYDDESFAEVFDGFKSALHADDFDRFHLALERHIREQVPFDVQCRLQRNDGEYNWFHVKGHALWDENGDAQRMVGSITDIDELIRSQQIAEEQREQLEQSEQRLQMALDIGQAGVWQLDLESRTFEATPGLTTILARTPTVEEILANGLWSLAHEEDRHLVHAAWQELSKGGTSPAQVEHRIMRPDGTVRWLLSLFDLQRDARTGNLSYVTGLSADITDRKLSEIALNEAIAKSEEANRLKTEFLANMSHEIRTPLNGMLGMAQLLEKTTLTDKQARFVRTIRSSGDALLSVINDVLDISKIEAGLLTLNMEPFAIETLMTKAQDAVIGIALQKGLTLDCSRSPNLPTEYLGDENRLKQILINLAGNAVKFTDEGSVTLKASIDASGMLRFEVQDTGPGIAPDQQALIFGRFCQADGSATRKHGGTGLGLAISRDLVKLMGGEIGIESTLGQGATFWFTVPLEAIPGEETDTMNSAPLLPTSSEPPEEPDTPTVRRRILLAEDNPVNQQMVADSLDLLDGVELTIAENGAEALDRLHEAQYDLILMDINMPVMTGEEAIQRIRSSQQAYAEIPIIVLTANVMGGQREHYLGIGANSYLAKPIDVDMLIESIEAFLPAPAVAQVG